MKDAFLSIFWEPGRGAEAGNRGVVWSARKYLGNRWEMIIEVEFLTGFLPLVTWVCWVDH